MPKHLLPRLRAISDWDDTHLDAGLRLVDLPEGMLDRLRAIPADELVDARLSELSPASNFLASCRAEAQLAADEESLLAFEIQPASLVDWQGAGNSRFPAAMVVGMLCILAVLLAGPIFALAPQEGVSRWTAVANPELPIQSTDNSLTLSQASGEESLVLTDLAEPLFQIALEGVDLPSREARVRREMDQMSHSPKLTETAFLARWRSEILGEPPRDERFQVEQVAPLSPRGVPAPLAPGFDRLFFFKYHVQPLVSPAAHPALASSRVSLDGSSASFDRMSDRLARRELPPAEEIRVEDFLAASEGLFPATAPGQVALRTAAGPSRFGGQRPLPPGWTRWPGDGIPRLMLVNVQVGDQSRKSRPATALTLALDGSASMAREGSWVRARRAIARVMEEMSPRDVLSIVVVGESPQIVCQEARRNQSEKVLAALADFQPEGACDLGEGLRAAADIALRVPLEGDYARELVLLSNGLPGGSEAAAAPLAALVADLAKQQVQFRAIDAGGLSTGGDRVLQMLAQAGGNKLVLASSPEEIRRVLVESLAGESATIGEDAVLQVRFRSESVAAWRLLGHEASIAGGLVAQSPESTLVAGQSTSALYEVWLTGTSDEVAEAQLTWRGPASGDSRTVQQRISRLQFASSWEEAPLPLQAAAVSAEAAEILRGSYFATAKNRNLQGLIAVANQANPRLRSSRAFREVMEVLEKVEAVRAGGRAP